MCSAVRSLCWAQPCYSGMQLTDKQASVAQTLCPTEGDVIEEHCQVKVAIHQWLRTPMEEAAEHSTPLCLHLS